MKIDRRLARTTWLIWLAIAAQWVIYAVVSRAMIGVAPLWVLLVLLGATLLLAGRHAVLTIHRLVNGPRRLAVIGWVLLAAAPAFWSGQFLGHVWYRATQRDSLRFNTPLRAIAHWAASIMDAEAVATKPRRTQGDHVTLYDAGETPDAEGLVTELDEHVAQMSALLESEPPDTQVRWVRGTLLGEGGRAMSAWALCDADEPEVTYLDRHEVAHVVITLLAGPRQNPPMLFAEGWAEYQSNDLADMVERLQESRSIGTTYVLADLIATDTYGASIGLAYSQGGPFVGWLVETYGGEKFLELYAGVRQDSFHADCQRIMGHSFDQLEQQFWQWLDDYPTPGFDPLKDVTLADGVSPADWQELIAAYQAAQIDEPVVPRGTAIAIELASTEVEGEITLTRDLLVRIICDAEANLWLIESSENHAVFASANSDFVLNARRYGDAPAYGTIGAATRRPVAVEAVRDQLRRIRRWVDVQSLLIESHATPWKRTIHRVQRPASPGECWVVEDEIARDDTGRGRLRRLEIDPRHRYWVSSLEESNFGPPPSDDPETVAQWDQESKRTAVFLTHDSHVFPVLASTQVEGIDYEFSADTTLRELTAAEQREVKQLIADVAAQIPESRDPWWLRHEWAFALLWPALGAVLVWWPRRSTTGDAPTEVASEGG